MRIGGTVAGQPARRQRSACAAASMRALHIGRRVGSLPKSWATVNSDTTLTTDQLAADRSRRRRAHRHPGHPGADVGRHRPAVPPARQAAWRRHGGLRDDRLLGDGPGEPQDARRWPRWTAAAASAPVQLAGCDPAAMAEAARLAVDRGADLIDINFGCPVKKVAVGQQAGSALMRDETAAAAHPGGHGPRGPGAGHAEDAHGLGPCQPERPAARPHRAGRRHPHGHRAWPHPPAILHRLGRLGLHRPGQARGRYPGDRQRRHPDRGGRGRGAAPVRRRRRDDRPRLLRPAVVPGAGGALPAHRRPPAGTVAGRSRKHHARPLRCDARAISAATPACASRASTSPGTRAACPARPSSAPR